MSKYRINHHYYDVTRCMIFMPQIKCWWGWKDLVSLGLFGGNAYNFKFAVRNEATARAFINRVQTGTHSAMPTDRIIEVINLDDKLPDKLPDKLEVIRENIRKLNENS